jgi:hypothetical protein
MFTTRLSYLYHTNSGAGFLILLAACWHFPNFLLFKLFEFFALQSSFGQQSRRACGFQRFNPIGQSLSVEL